MFLLSLLLFLHEEREFLAERGQGYQIVLHSLAHWWLADWTGLDKVHRLMLGPAVFFVSSWKSGAQAFSIVYLRRKPTTFPVSTELTFT